ncbi:MAG: restriction endonuclease [Bacteroidales bacterium]|nr:restriction endonuclease [Bacteroidales bacterium]
MNWKEYENDILTYFQETYPETTISFDQKVLGRYSKVLRQIDILIEGEIAGYQIKIAVDCKNFSKKVDVKDVESFCSMVEDVEAHQGVLITQKGYSKAAINRAHYGNQQVELDIINFEELKEFQCFEALSSVGHFCVDVPAPFGWVLDLKDKINSFATIHQRGLTLNEAQQRNEWMYMQFWKKDFPEFGIENLIEFQNDLIMEVDKGSKFSYKNSVRRKDGLNTKIRIAEVPKYPFIETTGFIEYESHIFFIVLFTPKELMNKNIRKLQHILKVAESAEIQFDNHQVILQCLHEINHIEDLEIKAEKYFQIAKWYKEMDDSKNAFQNYVKGIDCFPTHYTHLKLIIREALSQGLIEQAKKYSIQLFEIEPKNPTVPKDLIELYFVSKEENTLVDMLIHLTSLFTDNEILGNLNFHIGLTYLNMDKVEDANKYILESKRLFGEVYPKDHQVFKAINEFNKIKKHGITM